MRFNLVLSILFLSCLLFSQAARLNKDNLTPISSNQTGLANATTPNKTSNTSTSNTSTSTGFDLNAYNALLAQLTTLNNTINGLSWITGVPQFYYSGGVNLYNYMYRDAEIYQDIFKAYNLGKFQKQGTPTGWDEKSYSSALWYTKNILNIGAGINNNGNGMLVTVPSGFNVLWLRVLNDRWATFRAASAVYSEASIAIYAAGWRAIVETSPDGGEIDIYQYLHVWVPIPLYFPGNYMIYSDKNSDDWISGIAFGKNLWNHAKNSAVAYYWNLNGGTANIGWTTNNWNTDNLAVIPLNVISELYVPVYPSGNRKIVYIVEHNNNWVGTPHKTVLVNGVSVERFRTSYSNPFATHYNSKFYSRYMATSFPASLIHAGDKFIKLTVDMTGCNSAINFREIGTHDYI